MAPALREPVEADWDAIVALADVAVPWEPDGNREWLENRRRFGGRRRHYVAEDESGAVTAYGAVEEGPEGGLYRVFLVMAPENLRGPLGERVFDRLLADLRVLGARGMWAREHAADHAILSMLADSGMEEHSRFTPPGRGEMVVLMRALSAGPG